MRQITFILTFFISVSCGQKPLDFHIGQIKFRGQSIFSTLDEITKAFGNPQTGEFICGFSEADPSDTLKQLIYKDFNFVGGYEDNYVLSSIEFDTKGEIALTYGDIFLNGLTSKSDFADIFGKEIKDDSILLMDKVSDAGIIFTFSEGLLTKYEYWTPC